ncbi:hypothetical protein PC110_g21937 [Phytophthora cactorum]|uniref:Uncharacterized protein n=1 Tax=Phytophthora cactorum TaxID=29920 RepID=A0A329RAV9_9STRA|nr:hypothetical protein PC114_g25645 [Phytophthora cactorum]RAW21621.1 hypothetical protein PC110_g21937 [Phytophthora cactorum]
MSTGCVVMRDMRRLECWMDSSMDMRPCFSDRKANRWALSSWGGSNASPKSAVITSIVGKQEASATSLLSVHHSFAFPVNFD